MNTVFRKTITVDEISKKIHLILRYVNHNLKNKNKEHYTTWRINSSRRIVTACQTGLKAIIYNVSLLSTIV